MIKVLPYFFEGLLFSEELGNGRVVYYIAFIYLFQKLT